MTSLELPDFPVPRYSDMFPTVTDKDDWEYRDVPWCTIEAWETVFNIAGEGNYLIIVSTTMPRGGVSCRRGQVFFAPQAIENFKAHNAASK